LKSVNKCMGDKKPFTVPKALLNQIEECSCGGYILFTFDGDTMPQVYSHADNHATAMALQMQVINWGKALEASNIEITLDSWSRNGVDDDSEEE